MFTVIVTADENDGDYVYNDFVVDEDKLLYLQEICRKIKPVVSYRDCRIEDFDSSKIRESLKGVLTPEELDYLVDIIPTGKYGYAVLEEIRFLVGEPVIIF